MHQWPTKTYKGDTAAIGLLFSGLDYRTRHTNFPGDVDTSGKAKVMRPNCKHGYQTDGLDGLTIAYLGKEETWIIGTNLRRTLS